MSIKTDNSWGAVAGFTLVAALVGGFYLRQGPLETRRPDQGAVLAEVAADEFVLSRLWQDPLHAIQTDWNRIASMGTETDLPLDVRTIRSKLREESGKQLRLLVMMSGAPYAEDRENRRRQRHAVVSALTENDYVPKDHERLGYFTAPCFEKLCRRRSSVRSQNAGKAQQKMLIGFESYKPALELEALPEDNGNAEVAWDSVLVLWLNDDDFGPCALNQASALASYLDGESEPATTVLVGPTTSGDLSRLLPIGQDEKCRRTGVPWRRSVGTASPVLHVLSPRATAPLDLLFPDSNSKFRSCLRDRSVDESVSTDEATSSDSCLAKYLGVAWFDSVVARDDVVLGTILQELRDRGASQLLIAIVSEQDSVYGRLLDDVVAEVLGRDRDRNCVRKNESFEVKEYGYLTGVDGEMPRTAVRSDVPGDTDAGSPANGSAQMSVIAMGHRETAFGVTQLDYVRRLADRIADDLDEDENGDRPCEDETGNAVEADAMRRVAVGILGADVYDKLAILQALREELPFATFFTTDLDARFSHPDVYPFTRNLIVGSSYGLTIEGLGGAPFRDTYQTATYRAVALALDIKTFDIKNGARSKHATAPPPRLFEIGRTGAVDITNHQDGSAEKAYKRIHGKVSYIRSRSSEGRRIAEAVVILTPLLVLIALVLVSRTTLDEKTALLRRKARLRVAVVGGAAAVGLGILMWALRDGFEPWPLLEGVNSLPKLVMYVTIVVYACSIVHVMNARMTQTEKALAAAWGLPERTIGDSGKAKRRAVEVARRFRDAWGLWISTWRQLVPRDSGTPPEPVGAEVCWKQYLKYSDRYACAVRVAVSSIIGFIVVIVIECWFSPKPSLLTREFAEPLKWSERLVALACLVTIFYCSDLLKLSHAMTRDIARYGVLRWPEVPGTPRSSRYWRTMEFLERYTESVMPIAAAPFVLLSLHMLARSTLFEGWVSPLRILMVYAGLVGYVVVWALRFQREAVKAKSAILASLDRCRLAVVGDTAETQRLGVVKERIDGIHRGAFVPWIRHPIVSSLLLPSAAYGVPLLLEAMR